MRKKRIPFFLGHLLMGVVAVMLFGVATMYLWNALVPAIFGLTVIGFWQALGLLVLARLLFGGFGRGGKFGRSHHHRFNRNKIREKWLTMTPEERKEFVKNHHPGYQWCNEQPKNEQPKTDE
jgi:hypothetical protein